MLTTRLTFSMYVFLIFFHSVVSSQYHRICSSANYFWQSSEYRENRIHTGWLDSRIAMRVRAERPPWYLSVVGGALYVRKAFFVIICFCFLKFFNALVSTKSATEPWFIPYESCLLQKATASSAAVVSDYVGYLEKGQIPPKVGKRCS